MTDRFAGDSGDYLGPAVMAEAVTPSDSVDLTNVSRSLYVGTSGDVAAVMKNDDVVVFTGVPAGAWLPIRVKRVNSTNTTAGNIVAVS